MAKKASSWSGMGPRHHQTRGVGLDLSHHLDTLFPVLQASKGWEVWAWGAFILGGIEVLPLRTPSSRIWPNSDP